MKILISKFLRISILIMILAALAPRCPGQDLGAATRISTVPPGLYFSVDGQGYQTAMSAVWPTGSKHTLLVSPPTQSQGKTQFVFKDWEFAGGTFAGNPMIVTADPAIPEYQAVFNTQYDLSLLFYACGDPVSCQYSPGVIYVGTHRVQLRPGHLDRSRRHGHAVGIPQSRLRIRGLAGGAEPGDSGVSGHGNDDGTGFGLPHVSGGAPHQSGHRAGWSGGAGGPRAGAHADDHGMGMGQHSQRRHHLAATGRRRGIGGSFLHGATGAPRTTRIRWPTSLRRTRSPRPLFRPLRFC